MNWRAWHTWIGLVLGLPLFIVGITAVFIAHDKSWGTKYLYLPLTEYKDAELELRDVLVEADGSWWLATQRGVFRQQGEAITLVQGWDSRQLAKADGALWVASKEGLFRLQGEQVEQRLSGEIHGITRLPDGQWLAMAKEQGALLSTDGQQWQAWAGNAALLAAQGQVEKPYSVAKLMMDMHTGKLFFGKQGEWLWIDLLGIAMILLGFSGVWVWWRAKRRAAG